MGRRGHIFVMEVEKDQNFPILRRESVNGAPDSARLIGFLKCPGGRSTVAWRKGVVEGHCRKRPPPQLGSKQIRSQGKKLTRKD
jgi:hypothetical protein